MTIELDHVIVSARNPRQSAKRLGQLLGVRWAESGVGPFSPVYVNDGLTLDFTSSLMESSFVWHNPNVKRSCSCGKSFAV